MANQQPVINFTSDQLAYGPIGDEHLALSMQWANDFDISAPRGMILRPYSWDQVTMWSERSRGGTTLKFMIYEATTMRPIGETGFVDVDYFHRTAEFGITIGEKDCWGRGYGTEATRTMLRHGFTNLGFHSISLRVSGSNERGQRAYARAGFREVGRLREAQRIRGIPTDLIFMDCLAREFLGETPEQ